MADHGRRLLAAFSSSLQQFAFKQDLDLATELIVQIAMAPGRPASKERQHLRNLGFEIVSLSAQDPGVAVARISRENVSRLQERLTRYAHTPTHVGKSNLAAIDTITPVAASTKRVVELEPGDVRVDCLITLYAALPQETKGEVVRRIVQRLDSATAPPAKVYRFANGVLGIAARLTAKEIDEISEQFMFVRSIEANADLVQESATQADPLPTLISIAPPRCQSPVVIIDSGVNQGCPLLSNVVLQTVDELPSGSSGPHLAHGTFVATRAAYGDDILSVLTGRAEPWCPIIDIQVTGVDSIGNKLTQKAADLAEILQRVVPSLSSTARVYNISLGLGAIQDGVYSSVARLIDYLSREHQVLFVISAGNVQAPTCAPPNHFTSDDTRIWCPAESLLSLAVASMARYSDSFCAAEPGEISPFSRRGPGADGAPKPEVAEHGGNAIYSGGSFTTSPRAGVYGIGRSGTHLEYGMGTSYSAPVVAQYAARLFDAYPDATPNLVRALLCHFARPVRPPAGLSGLDLNQFCRFGAPDVEAALFSAGSSSTYLYQGSLSSEEYVFVPFHIPPAFASIPGAKLAVRVTVAFDPPVSPDESSHYSLCRVAIVLRKQTAAGLRDVQISSDDAAGPVPWNPVLRCEHAFRRGYATGEWEVRLRLWTRGELADDFRQSVAVVIEVVDEGAVTDVRADILNNVPGIYAPVVLRLVA